MFYFLLPASVLGQAKYDTAPRTPRSGCSGPSPTGNQPLKPHPRSQSWPKVIQKWLTCWLRIQTHPAHFPLVSQELWARGTTQAWPPAAPHSKGIRGPRDQARPGTSGLQSLVPVFSSVNTEERRAPSHPSLQVRTPETDRHHPPILDQAPQARLTQHRGVSLPTARYPEKH